MRQEYAEWIEALTIFARYADAAPAIAAEHDVVYAGPVPAEVSDEDRARLAELHWHEEEQYGCFARFT